MKNQGKSTQRETSQKLACRKCASKTANVPPADRSIKRANSADEQEAPADELSTLDPDQASQLRSTLAIGQLIVSRKPTAGSKLIAGELRNLSRTIQEESVSLRKDLNQLASTIKAAFEEERELRNMTAAANLNRRPIRRFPVFRGRGGYRLPNTTAQKGFRFNPSALTATTPTYLNASTSTSTSQPHVTSPNSPSPLPAIHQGKSLISEVNSASAKKLAVPSAAKSNLTTLSKAAADSAVAAAAAASKLPGSTIKDPGTMTAKDWRAALKIFYPLYSPFRRRSSSSNDGDPDPSSTETSPGQSPP